MSHLVANTQLDPYVVYKKNDRFQPIIIRTDTVYGKSF